MVFRDILIQCQTKCPGTGPIWRTFDIDFDPYTRGGWGSTPDGEHAIALAELYAGSKGSGGRDVTAEPHEDAYTRKDGRGPTHASRWIVRTVDRSLSGSQGT